MKNINEMKELIIEHIKLNDSAENIEEIATYLGVLCECCYNKGYVEVTGNKNEQYIEACDECNYFGIIGDVNAMAREVAEADGYQLSKTGKVLNEIK